MPRILLIAFAVFGVLGASVLTNAIIEERDRNLTTQEIKWGWMTISAILAYSDENPGKWPSQWSDLMLDASRKVDVDFSIKISDLEKDEQLIYRAIRLKEHPELQGHLKPDLAELRKQLLSNHRAGGKSPKD